MRIAFLARSLDAGGAERQLLVLAAGLRARGHEVLVIALQSGGRLEERFAANGIEVRALGPSRFPIAMAPVGLARVLRRFRPDLLHGYLPLANCVAVTSRIVVPRARTVMGVRGVGPERQMKLRRVKAFYRVEALMAQLASAIIANSEEAKRDLISRRFPPDRLYVIPNGIEVEQFIFDAGKRRQVRASWSIADDEILVGRVAGLRAIKDYPTFLQAAAAVAAHRSDVRFVCVGDGPEELRSELQSLSAGLGLEGRTRWAGHHDDIAAVMSALDVLVSSSVSESFPNVVAEAMACGVPCVVTDVGDSAAIVGPTGFVVPTGAPALMAEAILDAIPLANGRGRDEIRERIVASFGTEALVALTEAVFDRLVHGSPGRARPSA